MPRSTWISLAAAAVLGVAFGVLAWHVEVKDRLPELDRVIARAMKDVSETHNIRREIMVFFTYMGSIPAMALLALAGAAWQWQRGDRLFAIAWVSIVLGGGLLTLAVKPAFDRPRPPQEWRDEIVHETNESFPSGHSMGGMIGWGMLAYTVVRNFKRRRLKIAVVVLLALWVGMIGFSRIYLRAHWFSDVIGGFLIGLAWLEFWLAWVEFVRWRVERRAPL